MDYKPCPACNRDIPLHCGNEWNWFSECPCGAELTLNIDEEPGTLARIYWTVEQPEQ